MRVRTIGLLILLPALLLPAGSARSDLKNDVRLGAKWKQGERRSVELVHTFQRSRNGREVGRGGVTRKAELEVLAASQSGFTVRWKFTSVQANRPLTELPVAEWLLLLKDVEVVVEADRAGDFNEISNWQEAGTQARQSCEGLLQANPGLKEAESAEFRRLVQAIFANKRAAEAFFAREIRLCTFMLGWYIAPGKPETYPDLLPNPFGGEPFPSRATLLLREYNRGTGSASLRWWQNLNPEEARRILKGSAEAEAQKLGMPAPAKADIPSLHIGDTAEIELDNHTGWLRTLQSKRTIVLRKGADEMREVRTLKIAGRSPLVGAR